MIIPFWLFPYSSSCQSMKKIVLLSSMDSLKIEYAHVFTNDSIVTFSDENGEFKLNLDKVFQYIKVAHLNYHDKILLKEEVFKKDTIFLNERSNVLDEIVLSVKKKKKKKIVLLPERSPKDFLMKKVDIKFPYGFMIAVYVPNKYQNKKFTIRNIIIKARGESVPNARYIPFKINLMTVDSISRLPKVKIFNDDIVTGRKENQSLLKINLGTIKEVEFPKQGVYVVLSIYDEKFYKEKGFKDRPGFAVTQITNKSKFRELHWKPFYGKYQWREPFYSKEKIQCFNFGIEIENIDE